MSMLRWSDHRRQHQRWPRVGRHILAQHDDQHIIVYQAHTPAVASAAVAQQSLNGLLAPHRMWWFSPSFLWTMHRTDWGCRPQMEHVLAIQMACRRFDELLEWAVDTRHHPDHHTPDRAEWRKQHRDAPVRLQWDPDHSPDGWRLSRRAVVMGLRGVALHQWTATWIVAVEDITEQIHRQRRQHQQNNAICTPRATIYNPSSAGIKERIRLDRVR